MLWVWDLDFRYLASNLIIYKRPRTDILMNLACGRNLNLNSQPFDQGSERPFDP